MKTVTVLLVLFGLFMFCTFLSCKKDKDDDKVNQEYIIKGVRLVDATAIYTGAIGTPEDIVQTEGFKMDVYPIPCNSTLSIRAEISNTEILTIKTRIVHALYPNAPDSFTKYSFEPPQRMPILVENKGLEGKEAFSDSQGFQKAPNGQRKTFNYDLSNLPKGFYKVFVEASDGRKLHIAIFKQ